MTNLRSRIQKLEAVTKPEQKLDWWEEAAKRQAECTHPPSMFNLYREYPSLWRTVADEDRAKPNFHQGTTHILDRVGVPFQLTVAGHCDSCGFDCPLWDVSNLSAEEWETMLELEATENESGSPNEHQGDIYKAKLIAEGKLSFTPWPPSPEILESIKLHGGSNQPGYMEAIEWAN